MVEAVGARNKLAQPFFDWMQAKQIWYLRLDSEIDGLYNVN